MLVSHILESDAPMPAETMSGDAFGHIKSRSLRELIAYWFDKRGRRPMPSRGDIDPIEIPSVLARIWLCDYLPESGRFRYRLAGEKINAFWGQSVAGRHLDEIVPADRLASASDKARMACELPAILHDRVCLSLTEEIAENGERLMLPLSDDGVRVNALLGASHCKWLSDLEFDPYVACSETTTVVSL